ncbi:hypothetical protein GCM10022377_10160 [Zhihengliuella alba]|uniref:Head-to-tail adaptor n=1 Tax=Zhihengliuella alba TaxID=547018 RepID=A0ABP7D3M0_9MICC
MAYATVDDVSVRLGRALTTAETAQVTAWLDDLEAMVLSRVPDFAEQVAAGDIPAGVVRSVFATAIIRVLNNPKGLRQHTVSIDDFSRTETVDSALSSGALYLTDEEWGLLSPGSSGDAFTITPYNAARLAGYWSSPTTWESY